MKNKQGYILILNIFMLLIALPLLYWTLELTSVPYNIVPNVVGREAVPYLKAGSEYVQLGGWLGATLYLGAAVVSALGIFCFRKIFTTVEITLQLVLFLGSLGTSFLLRELYLLTVFPLTLVSGIYLAAAWSRRRSLKNE